MHKIPLNKGKFAIIDEKDIPKAFLYKWHFNINGYARTSTPVKMYLHHLIITPKKGQQIDHINGDRLDNRRANLRVVTEAQNHLNQKLRINNTSGYKGVGWSKDKKKWYARLKVFGVYKHLGYFDDKIEAAKKYNQAAVIWHGEFARLNKI